MQASLAALPAGVREGAAIIISSHLLHLVQDAGDCLGARLFRQHDAQLIAVGSDHADRLGLDLVIDAKSLCDGLASFNREILLRAPIQRVSH